MHIGPLSIRVLLEENHEEMMTRYPAVLLFFEIRNEKFRRMKFISLLEQASAPWFLNYFFWKGKEEELCVSLSIFSPYLFSFYISLSHCCCWRLAGWMDVRTNEEGISQPPLLCWGVSQNNKIKQTNYFNFLKRVYYSNELSISIKKNNIRSRPYECMHKSSPPPRLSLCIHSTATFVSCRRRCGRRLLRYVHRAQRVCV